MNVVANAKMTLVATGSEVSIILSASRLLRAEGIETNVVSMPCVERFLAQELSYQSEIIREEIPALFMEAAQGDLWHRLLPKSGGDVIGINSFGESSPADDLYTHFGLTAERVKETVKSML